MQRRSKTTTKENLFLLPAFSCFNLALFASLCLSWSFFLSFLRFGVDRRGNYTLLVLNRPGEEVGNQPEAVAAVLQPTGRSHASSRTPEESRASNRPGRVTSEKMPFRRLYLALSRSTESIDSMRSVSIRSCVLPSTPTSIRIAPSLLGSLFARSLMFGGPWQA